MGVSGGFVLSAFAFWLVQKLPESDFMSWGWRVPFLLSIVIFLVGMYIRKNIRESKAFTQAKPQEKHEKIPLLVLVREHPKALLQAIALRLPEKRRVVHLFHLLRSVCQNTSASVPGTSSAP